MPEPVTEPSPRETAAARRRRGLLVTLFFVALTIVFTWPLPAQLGTHQLGRGTDPDLYMWTLGWNAQAFLHQPLAIFDANIFYPARHTLAYSENLIGSALLVAPWIWATGDLMTAMNVVEISSVVLSALGAYVLARRVGLGVAGAILAGIIFGFTPARLLRMPQIHVTTIQWIPFCLAFLHAYFGPGGRPSHLRWAAVFFTAQALASGHGAVFLTVASVALVLYRVVLGEPVAIMRRLRDLGLPGLLALVPSVLLLIPYRRARQDVATLDRGLDDYGSSLSSYLSSPSHLHEWLWARLPAWLTSPPPDAHLFPGLLPIVLALVGLATWWSVGRATAPAGVSWRARWRDNPVPFYGLITALSVWFTLGPPFGLWRWTYWLPVFSFLRVPSRFVLLEILALAILAGFGFEGLTRKASSRRRAAVAAVMGLLLVVEFAPMPLETDAYTVETLAADRWLATRPKPFAVAEVPVPDSLSTITQSLRNTLYMLHSTAHWQKIVHGYSGVEPEAYTALHWKLTRFPDDESLRALTDIGVDYVVMHPRLYPESELADAEARFERYKAWLKLEYLSPDGRVYSLRRPE